MKRILLAAFAFATISANAQFPNASFENWKTDTTNFAGISGSIPPDTFSFEAPIDWTTSNALSGTDSLGGFFFVSKDSLTNPSGANARSGNYSIKLITDTLRPLKISGIPFRLTLGGFAVNGNFVVDESTILGGGSTITPGGIVGAGQPQTQPLGSVAGYFKYDPVFNTNTNSYDTCIIWATLRKGSLVVADAIFKSADSTGGFRHFSADFKYVSCDAPDTLVIFISSSIPKVAAILGGGSSGLKAGSVLWADSVYYTPLPANFSYPPIAVADTASTTKNVAKVLDVKANDSDCDDAVSGLTVTVSTNAINGTTSVTGNVITYTPNNNFVGVDSFFYTLSDGATSVTARVRMFVLNTVGINETNQVAVSIYPVPASNQLNIQFENENGATANVYNMIGNLVLSTTLSSNNNVVNVSNLANGFYGIQIVNNTNTVIARSNFTIAK